MGIERCPHLSHGVLTKLQALRAHMKAVSQCSIRLLSIARELWLLLFYPNLKSRWRLDSHLPVEIIPLRGDHSPALFDGQ